MGRYVMGVDGMVINLNIVDINQLLMLLFTYHSNTNRPSKEAQIIAEKLYNTILKEGGGAVLNGFFPIEPK